MISGSVQVERKLFCLPADLFSKDCKKFLTTSDIRGTVPSKLCACSSGAKRNVEICVLNKCSFLKEICVRIKDPFFKILYFFTVKGKTECG